MFLKRNYDKLLKLVGKKKEQERLNLGCRCPQGHTDGLENTEPLQVSKQRHEMIGFGFRKLILVVGGKKDGLDEDQMKNRQFGREAPERFWWGIKGGLNSSQGGRESQGDQIWEIQNTAQIETSK